MSDDEALFLEYLRGINALPHKTRRPFIVAMVGLVGSGKSTFATQLADTTGIFIDSNDSIRRFLNGKGFGGTSPVQGTLEYIGQRLGEYLRSQKVGFIIDADVLKFHEMARRNAENSGAKFYLIKIECPEDVIKTRTRERVQVAQGAKCENLSRAGLEEFERRKRIYQETAQPDCDFTVYTERPLGSQLQTLCNQLRADGVLA